MVEGAIPNVPQPGHGEDILALGRLISYACQEASALNLDLSRHLLEIALRSVMDDIQLSDLVLELPSKPVSHEVDAKVH
jgi:hypothetical protein